MGAFITYVRIQELERTLDSDSGMNWRRTGRGIVGVWKRLRLH